ncbi:hypothetical protein [Nocardioides guangzhouensis]|uniref:hypothetical protein n=1 Tax=Nocardioides guangzhouensis TaxID=2497878 RepID=UPI00143853C8|nr:hypothetical protein [Nocardioides guangzhouensis]
MTTPERPERFRGHDVGSSDADNPPNRGLARHADGKLNIAEQMTLFATFAK